MNKNKPIGGFFELEVPLSGQGYHPNALALTTGRACMKWILEEEMPSRVYVPFYTCCALYAPMEEMGVEVVFYAIDENLDPVDLPEPGKDELLIFINYFGLKTQLSKNLSLRLGKKLVVDDTHNFFYHGYKSSYSFTSARKHFGVPDGAYLYGAENNSKNIERNTDISVQHNIKRLLLCQDEAYSGYVDYEASLGNSLKAMSLLSERLLAGVDYESASKSRVRNYKYLHDRLGPFNKLSIDMQELTTPFCYPFLPESHIDKKEFYLNMIFVPTLWPDILERKDSDFDIEKLVVRDLLPLPIDQRYTEDDMERIVEFITEKIK